MDLFRVESKERARFSSRVQRESGGRRFRYLPTMPCTASDELDVPCETAVPHRNQCHGCLGDGTHVDIRALS